MTDPEQRSSSVVRGQSFSGARAESDRADKALEHQHEQERLDNAQRRRITAAVGGFLVAVTVITMAIAIGADNDATGDGPRGSSASWSAASSGS